MTADPRVSEGPGRRRGSVHQGMAILLLLAVVPAAVATVQGLDQPSTPSPPIALTAGDDLAAAQARGLVTQGAGDGDQGETDLQLHVPVGARVTIDRLLEIHATDEVDDYELDLTQASAASVASASGVTVRLWTGEVAPQADDAPQVCQVLVLDGASRVASGTCDAAAVHVQLIVEVPEGHGAPGRLHLVTTASLER